MNLVRQGQESIEGPSSSCRLQRYFEKVSGGYQQQCWYCAGSVDISLKANPRN